MKIEVRPFQNHGMKVLINGSNFGWTSYFEHNISAKVYIVLRSILHLTDSNCIRY